MGAKNIIKMNGPTTLIVDPVTGTLRLLDLPSEP